MEFFRLSKQDFIHLSQIITEAFPSEAQGTYYAPPSKSKNPIGKLMSSYSNLRNILTDVGIITREQRRSSHNLSVLETAELTTQEITYELIMKNSGPLNQFSNMRFEGKHDLYKKALHATHNHKNLLHTLGVKSQFQFSHFLLNFNFNDACHYQKINISNKPINANIPFIIQSDVILESVVVLGKII